MAKSNADREKRLADALRQNLRRRKEQARTSEPVTEVGKNSAFNDVDGQAAK
jgi:hypothetical protein